MGKYHVRTCKQCGEKLQGRSDKLFCDAYCRNTFNNQNRSDGEQTIIDVNVILRKNRKILKELSPMGKATVRREVLDELGYDYRYFTNLYKSQKQTYFVCYDFALASLVDSNGIKKALIVKTQEYFNKYLPDPWV